MPREPSYVQYGANDLGTYLSEISGVCISRRHDCEQRLDEQADHRDWAKDGRDIRDRF